MNFFIASLMVILTGAVILTFFMAIEVFVLILLGLTYESWQALVLFIILFGIIEYIVSSILQKVIELKKWQNPNLHRFWGQTFISFILMMVFVRLMDEIWISTAGAIAYALITAALYIIVDRKGKEAA